MLHDACAARRLCVVVHGTRHSNAVRHCPGIVPGTLGRFTLPTYDCMQLRSLHLQAVDCTVGCAEQTGVLRACDWERFLT